MIVRLCAALLVLLAVFSIPASAQTTQPDPERDARMKWWREARFGMFIHWGLYAVPAGTYQGKQIPDLGEWIMLNARIPLNDYKSYAAQFNPTHFNADEWVSLAKNAGMKYIIITSKHHDGFAMFDSAASDYNIVAATPFKRDPLKELAAACQKQGIKLGFYYSQCQDWGHPGGAVLERRGPKWDPAQQGDFNKYVHEVAIPQVRELLTNYGPIAVIWWDTQTPECTPDIAREFQDLLKLQPGIIQNNRLGGGIRGDTETPEQRIPAAGFPGRDWETCMTINGTWGYKSYDTNFKSTETLLRNLIDIASKGGNYLLNVGPTAEGIIPQPEAERLQQMGKWLAVNGEAIYGTGPTAFGPEAGPSGATTQDSRGRTVPVINWDWRCTTKPGKIYLHMLKWPGTSFTLNDVKGTVSKAYLLADPQRSPLKFEQDGAKVTLTLPANAPDPVASVVCLETSR
jgi:alpha-L-fucosidase